MKNIISNVVANALRHTEKGGILIEWGELVDEVVGEDEALRKKDSIRIGISMFVLFLSLPLPLPLSPV